MRDRLAYPGTLRRKVHPRRGTQITRDAWNALLKSLEEPPDFVVFMFASTEPSGFPPAILSRLQRYDVRRLSIPEIEGKLSRILEADGRTVEPAALSLIARLAAGGMRDAESILDQLLTTTTDVVTEAGVRDLLGLADAAAVDGFVTALETGDMRPAWRSSTGSRSVAGIRGRCSTRWSIASGSASSTGDRRCRCAGATWPDDSSRSTRRAGIGGLRLQLELALFAGTAAASTQIADRPRPAPPPAASAPEAAASTPTAPAAEQRHRLRPRQLRRPNHRRRSPPSPRQGPGCDRDRADGPDARRQATAHSRHRSRPRR